MNYSMIKNKLQKLGLLTTLLTLSIAQREPGVLLQDASIAMKTLVVSKRTQATLTMNRVDGEAAAKWNTNQCFELYIESPYKDDSYQPFMLKDPTDNKNIKPICFSPKKPEIKIECNLKDKSDDTIQFRFTAMPDNLAKDQVVWIGINNFHTPWSG